MTMITSGQLHQRSEFLCRKSSLAKNRPQGPASQFLVERHDNDSAIRVTKFDVAASLAALFKSHLGKNSDGVCS
jgi:hypothetical protein